MNLRALGIAARVAASTPALLGLRRRRDRARTAVPGLRRPVEVLRDRWGVPHVYAADEADLFLAQGYLHARERLWQMELQRRLATGRLAAVLGPDALDTDRLVRILGLNRAAEHDAAHLPADVAVAVDAYARGVCAYLATGERPLELRALRIRPATWTRADVLSWGRMMGLVLSGNWATELLRAAVVAAVGPDTATRLGVVAPGLPAELADLARVVAGRELTVPAVADLLQHGPDATKGSNCWVVGGSQSVTGAPLLACDPHLTLQVPSLWFENHLEGGGIRVTGAGLPGSPGVVIGHNERLAWGVTNARVDVQDVYVERVAGDAYLTEDGWRPLIRVREEIEVRGRREPHVEEVVLTRHGPIVTALAPDPVRPGDGAELALRWVGADPGALVGAVLALDRADGPAALRAALAGWTYPAQNVLWADVGGHLGYALAGTVPVRAAGDGGVPVPGWTGEYEWTGTVAAADLPTVQDPPEDVLVSANDGLLGDSGDALPGEWLAGYRAARIAELLDARRLHDVASFTRMQADLVSLPGRRLAALAPGLPADTGPERAARSALAGWDGTLDAGSVGGAVYAALRRELLTAAYAEVAEPLGLRAGLGGLVWQPGVEFLEEYAVERVLRDLAPGDPLLAPAWRAALAGLQDRWGDDVASWSHGRDHRLELTHPLGGVPLVGRLLNPVSAATGGDVDTVCPGQMVTKVDGSRSYGGASYRQVFDLADWDRGGAIHLPGQSGRPGDRHYADLVRPWLSGELHPTPWRRPAVEAAAEHREMLIPPSRTPEEP